MFPLWKFIRLLFFQDLAPMKDFYAILEVSPMSTREEIRRRFRELAKQYHPDTAGNDPYAAARFQDIKEAYETLTQPQKKEAWLKERWLRKVYNAGMGETAPLTPFVILEKTLKLERQVAAMDVFRMDHAGVVQSICNLLSDENISCLEKFHEPDMNRTILRHLLLALKPIPFPFQESAIARMKILAGTDAEARELIGSFQKKQLRRQRKEKLTIPLVILATLLICVLIYLAGRH